MNTRDHEEKPEKETGILPANEETNPPPTGDEEIDMSQYEDLLDDMQEESEPKKEPLSHTLMMVVSAILLISTIAVMAWGYTDVQKERQEALSELSLQKGTQVELKQESDKKAVEKKELSKISFEDAQKKLKEPMARYGEHATKMDEISMKFFENPDIAYTTEWKMEYQGEMKQLREANEDIQDILAVTEDGVLDEYADFFNEFVNISDVRYEAIVEKDAEKMAHVIMMINDLEKNLPESAKWFE